MDDDTLLSVDPGVEQAITAVREGQTTKLDIRRMVSRLISVHGAGHRGIVATAPRPRRRSVDETRPFDMHRARHVFSFIRDNPERVEELSIYQYDIRGQNDVLHAMRDFFLESSSTSSSGDTSSSSSGQLKTVALRQLQMDNEGLDIIRPAFFNNASVTSLDVSENRLQGARSGEILRNLLAENETLQDLDVSNQRLGPLGAREVGHGLVSNHILVKLNLSYCLLGNEGVENLLPPASTTTSSSTCLKYLDLSWNRITGPRGGHAIRQLLERFTHLEELKVQMNRLGPHGGRALGPGLIASTTKHLKSLDLSNCELGNQGVAHLIPVGECNASITYLNLENNHIEGEVGGLGLGTVLSRFCRLQKVLLGRNPLGPQGARAFITGLKQIRHTTGSSSSSQRHDYKCIDMCGCSLGNDGMQALAEGLCSMDCVQVLVLVRNGITSAGLVPIAKMIRDCKTLQELRLCGNHGIFQDRRAVEALASALSGSDNLRRFVSYCYKNSNNDPNDDWVETVFMAGMETNCGLHGVGMPLSDSDNRRRLREITQRNRILTNAKSLVVVGNETNVSVSALSLALRETSRCENGASASYMIFRNLICPQWIFTTDGGDDDESSNEPRN